MKHTSSVPRRLAVALVCAALAAGGCDDGDSKLGDGHDFGDNNPDLHVAMGDSITRLGDYPGILAGIIGKPVVNEGVPGATSGEGAARVNSVLQRHKPGFVLIMYGANDVIHQRGTDQLVANLSAMVAAARNRKTIPVIATLTPAFGGHAFMEGGIKRANERIRQLAKQESVALADVASAFDWDPTLLEGDGLHPNSAGRQRIADTFAGVLR